MDLKRRDFLKGLMAIAGVAAVGLPPVEDSVLISDVEQFLASGGEPDYPTKPTGPYGSIRIGDKWHALRYASVGMHRNVYTYRDGPDEITVPTSMCWTIDCEVDTKPAVDIFSREMYPIEINMNGRTFKGNALIVATSGNVFPTGDVRHAFSFEGVGPLNSA